MATFGDFPPEHKQQETRSDNPPQDSWERRVLQDLAYAALKEQRASRRWGYAFKGFFLLYLVAFLIIAMPSTDMGVKKPHTALVEVQGVIAASADANADSIVTGLRRAFENPEAKALILRLNTPGGSPVQAGIINDELHRLRSKRPDFPVYAVVQDICASGGYYIAVAADQIYADKASIIGSIGVRMDGFGFTEAIDKLGIERRALTAGENKSFMDPFLPLEQDDVDHARDLLQNIHQQFIDVVQTGRGDRLKDGTDLFTGLVWTGEQALQLGLIDGLASAGTVAREIIGFENIVDYTPRPNYLDRFAGRFGASVVNHIMAQGWSLR